MLLQNMQSGRMVSEELVTGYMLQQHFLALQYVCSNSKYVKIYKKMKNIFDFLN